MADAFSSSDSDGEFEGFTVEKCTKAEERDVRKQLEIVNDVDSDISVSDLSDDEFESEESDDEDNQPLAEIARWTENLGEINAKDFSGPAPGPTTFMDKSKSELDFFHLLFPSDYYDEIARQTNAYADRSIAAIPNPTWYLPLEKR